MPFHGIADRLPETIRFIVRAFYAFHERAGHDLHERAFHERARAIICVVRSGRAWRDGSRLDSQRQCEVRGWRWESFAAWVKLPP